MEKFNAKQEAEYLKKCMNINACSNGSSRVVYDLGDVVCKVAISSEGRQQNGNEVQSFLMYSHWGCLAKILGFGKYIVVMEKVAPIEYDYVLNRFEDYNSLLKYGKERKLHMAKIKHTKKYKHTKRYKRVKSYRNTLKRIEEELFESVKVGPSELEEVIADIEDVIEQVNECNGLTVDNQQVGLNKQGQIRCYDYGLFVDGDISTRSQVGSLYSWVNFARETGENRDNVCSFDMSPAEMAFSFLTKKLNFKRVNRELHKEELY